MAASSNNHDRRGLTLLELMLSIAVTAIIGVGIAGMLGGMTAGIDTRRDVRGFMINASAAQVRLSAYIAPSRCVLSQYRGDLILWFQRSRVDNVVYASEVRWLLFDEQRNAIRIFRVEFPDDWSEAEKQLADNQYPANANWYDVLDSYADNGWVSGYDLIDGIESVSIALDDDTVLESRHVSYRLVLAGATHELEMTVASTIHQHEQPDS